MTGYVYMTASQKGGTIYIGVTNDLARRMPSTRPAKAPASPTATVCSVWSGTSSISISPTPSSARRHWSAGHGNGRSNSSKRPIRNGASCFAELAG